MSPAPETAKTVLIAVDWGTTNRRRFALAADGTVLAQASDDRGILAVSDFSAEIAALRDGAAGVPLLLAGMVGSNRGWRNVPYVTAPAGLAAIAAGIVTAGPGIRIIPGVLFDDPTDPDIMRGEETQIIGALATAAISDGLICLPGTHTKWVPVSGGRITRFRTIMTGDIFAALSHRSILSDLLGARPGVGAAFRDGVAHSLANADLPAALFGTRARVVTGRLAAADAAARISGLLIGADIRIGLGAAPGPVVLVGAPDLCARFAVALACADRTAKIIDGAAAFAAGAYAIVGTAG